ncbi:hypothetical protein FRC01_002778 [Tulasnella sp. 417]|nr:hypothetical protein FRC01_002778 [Tulasnella sp. 417]
MTDKKPYYEFQNEPQVIMLICGPEEYRKSPEQSGTSSIFLSLLKVLRKCWNFEAEGRPTSTICLNQVQLIHSATENTIPQPIYQPSIPRPPITILRASALRTPAEESSNPLQRIPPTPSILAPSAKTVPERGVQLVEAFYTSNPGPSLEEHAFSSPDLYTKRPRRTPALARQSSHAERALRTVKEQSQSAHGRSSYERSSPDAFRQGTHEALRPPSFSNRAQATPPTPISAPDHVIAPRDYATQPWETNKLDFQAGEVIRVFSRSPTDWSEGELNGQRGRFPGSYVSTNAAAFARGVEPAGLAATVPSVSPDEFGSRDSQFVSMRAGGSTVLPATIGSQEWSQWRRGASSLPDADSGTQRRPAQLRDEGNMASTMLRRSSDDDTTWSSELDTWSVRARESWAVSAILEGFPPPQSPMAPAMPAPMTSIPSSWSGSPDFACSGVSPSGSPARTRLLSPSSVSSLSSYDSASEESDSHASDPDSYFPSGDCTSSQALATLRTTHARLQSIIAAFIGYTNFYSRLSDPSSKKHLIETARMIVDHVRYLSSLADALEGHQGIRKAKPREIAILKQARGTLERRTSGIEKALKDMLANQLIGSMDAAKAKTLRAATVTLWDWGECARALKGCLKTETGEDEFVINIAFVLSSATPTDTRSPSVGSSRTSSFPSSTPKSAVLWHGRDQSIGRPKVSSVRLVPDAPSAPISKRVPSWRPAHSNARPVRSDSAMRRPLEAATGDLPEEVDEELTKEGKETPKRRLPTEAPEGSEV